jgi:hypothetical protein
MGRAPNGGLVVAQGAAGSKGWASVPACEGRGARRLEGGIAAPGAICLSEDAYRQAKGWLDLKVTDLGPTHLKNIAEPIRAYSLQVGVPAKAKPAPAAEPAIGRRADVGPSRQLSRAPASTRPTSPRPQVGQRSRTAFRKVVVQFRKSEGHFAFKSVARFQILVSRLGLAAPGLDRSGKMLLKAEVAADASS